MSETPNTITGIKRELLMRLGHDADIFALISLCTREPYVSSIFSCPAFSS